MKHTKIYQPSVKLPTLYKRNTNASWAMKLTDKATGKRVAVTLPLKGSQTDPATGKEVPCNKALKYAEGLILDNIKETSGYLEKAKTRSTCCSVGQICEAYVNDVDRRCQDYVANDNVNCLLRILKETGYGEPEKAKKYSAGILNSGLIRKYKKLRLQGLKRGTDEYETASRTLNASYRMAKSLFSIKQLKNGCYDELDLPSSLSDFTSVPCMDVADPEYTWLGDDEFDEVFRTAEIKRITHPGMYCAFLLASGCGLRKNEIIHAHRGWLRFDEACGKSYPIRPTTNIENLLRLDGVWFITVPKRDFFKGNVFTTKGKKTREVPIPARVVRELLRLNSLGYDPEYLVPTKTKTKRVKWIWQDFSHWFKEELGIKREKSAHECRKFFGAQVATKHGIYVAQQYLGHASVTTTEKYYACLCQDKPQLSVQLPKCLGDDKVISIEESPRTGSEESK